MLMRAHIFFFCSGHQAPSGLAGCQISGGTGWWRGLMSCPAQNSGSMSHHRPNMQSELLSYKERWGDPGCWWRRPWGLGCFPAIPPSSCKPARMTSSFSSGGGTVEPKKLAHTCNPSTGEAETRGSTHFWGQPGLHRRRLLKNKWTKEGERMARWFR